METWRDFDSYWPKNPSMHLFLFELVFQAGARPVHPTGTSLDGGRKEKQCGEKLFMYLYIAICCNRATGQSGTLCSFTLIYVCLT